MKTLTEYIKEQLTINEGGIESDKFLLVEPDSGHTSTKELEEEWRDCFMVAKDPHLITYAIPKDSALELKEIYKDNIKLYVIPVKEYPYLNNFEDAWEDGKITTKDLEEYKD